MGSMKGPGIFLMQFARDEAPFNTMDGITQWVADLGYKGIQIPTSITSLFDLDTAAESKDYCDDLKGKLAEKGLTAIELGSYLESQCMAFNPAYGAGFEAFHPAGLTGDAITEWAAGQMKKSVRASVNLGTTNIAGFTGGLQWHMIYPWPQRPEGLVEEGFKELGRRWLPILDYAKDNGVTFSYELHPGSDVHDGASYEMFLDQVGDHSSACIIYDPSHFVLQQLDYLEFIKIYGERIRSFHVKDAEFNPTGRVGAYGGYQDWKGRAGRFRSLGDGQVDFSRVFTLMAEAGYEGWAILEWECCIKSPAQGAAEGAPFIANHIIDVTDVAFDDFAGGKTDMNQIKRLLGLA